jgi:flagellar hook-associated protein 1
MGLFSVLSLANTGLSASQLGMDIAGQNISNADVEGYSRKVLTLVPDYRYDGQFGQMGFGVDVKNIQRQRDAFIDQQIQGENQKTGYFNEISTTLKNVENVFADPGENGMQNSMDQFFDAWQNLANNPADSAARTALQTTGQTLVNVFHSIAGQLSDIRSSMNTKISNTVDKVNDLSKQIYNLNQEIATVEIGGQNANDSRDKRDQLVKELSKLVDITVTENERGQISVASAGSLLVSPVFYQPLEITTRAFVNPDGSTRTDIGVQWKNSKLAYLPIDGQMKAQFDLRDQTIPAYQNYLDTLAKGLVVKVNEIHERGFNLMGYTGFSFFSPVLTGASDISLSNTVLSNIQNIATAAGQDSQPFTEGFAAGGLVFGNPPVNLAHRSIIEGSVRVTSGATVLRENVDYHVDYATGTIQTLNNIYDAAAITVDYEYNTGSFKGPGDNSVAIAIAQLRQNATMNQNATGAYTATFTEYYSAFVGKLGLNVNEADQDVSTHTLLTEQYQTQQYSIAGVSLDEEMTNMIKNQHMYAAAARIVTTASEMLDVLIKM